jgi:signal transduction histidine kinase
MMAAIALYLGGYHLLLYLKRRDAKSHLPFSLLCFCGAAYDLFCIGVYSATSVTEGVPWQRLQLYTVNAISVCTVWFVATYVGKQKSMFIRLLCAWFLVLLGLMAVLPSEWTLSPLRPVVRTVHIFGNLRATYYEGQVRAPYLVGFLSSILAYAYLLKLLVDRYRKVHDRRIAVIIAGQVAYFGGVISDSLASAQVHSGMYVSEYAFMLVILSMAYVLLDEFVGLYTAVEESNRDLDLKVVERTLALARRNTEMRLVLDTVAQGLATINRQGRFSGERSAAFDRWFGVPSPESTFVTHVAPSDLKLQAQLQLGWDQLIENVLPMELNLQQMPQRMTVGSTVYALAFTPIEEGEQVSGALVTVSDVTAEVAVERAVAAQREFAQVLDRAIQDRTGFVEFVTEVGHLVTQIRSRGFSDNHDLLRALHTVKGNCSLFGVESVAEVAHQIESMIQESPQNLAMGEFEQLSKVWAHFTQRLSVLAEMEGSNRIEMSSSEIDDLAKIVLSPIPREQIAESIRLLKFEPIAIRFERFRRQISILAQRLGKPTPTVIIESGGLRLPVGHWKPFWLAFVHILRNSVDHGIELEEDRKRAGKPAVGKISMEARTVGNGLTIQVRDDGRGIDWEAVKSRAQHMGLQTADHTALVDAIFSEGVSTSADISSVSGRGVGLTAVREVVRALGGHVDVESVTGQGTTFTFSFPPSAHSNPLQEGPLRGGFA